MEQNRIYVIMFTFIIMISLLNFSLGYVTRSQQDNPTIVQSAMFQKQVKAAKHIYDINNVDKTANSTEHHPADVIIYGDPTTDKDLDIKVKTPIKTFNLNLQRLDKNILHDDFKVLSVFTDNTGKTVFHEDARPQLVHEKAKHLHFYHDPLSGTILSVKPAHTDLTTPLKHHVEGIVHDEYIIAPPTARRRHRRAVLHPQMHTMWTKAAEVHDFVDDELFVPSYIDSLPFPTQFQTNTPSSTSYSSGKNGEVPYEHVRNKRQVNVGMSRIEPELLLFCDNAMVKQFDGDTEELLEYLLHFWHAVNWKFLTISLQRKWPHIDLKIREIGVFRDSNAQPFIEENRIRQGSRLFSLYDAMDSLQRWLVKYETVLPLHDIAFLQTGNDACRMTSHTRRFKDSRFTSEEEEEEVDGCVAGTAGVAYVRGACLSAPYFRKLAYNFGIGEASTSFNGVIIAAHEVGHLLGAYHDGEAEARNCASNSGYIMSYSREDAYKFSRFSPCSVSSFQNFIRMDRSGCLKQRASNEIMQFPTSFPGTYMSINEQCRRFTGGPPCEVGPKQCEHLCCDDAKGQWRYTRSEPAVDGTTCGTGNICLNGQCISLASFG